MTRQMGEFERWASGIASTAVGSWGMRRGGVVGLIALAGAGFLAWRAGTGRSVMPESGRALLEKAVPALAHQDEAPREAPARRAPAKSASNRRTPANAAPARQGKSSTASVRKPKATAAKSAAGTTNGAKSVPQRRKVTARAEDAAKTIN